MDENAVDQIVAAILAASFCSKAGSAPAEDYITHQQDFVRRLKEARRRPPLNITKEHVDEVRSMGRRRRV